VPVKELGDEAAGVDRRWLVELRPGHPAQHRHESGGVCGIVVVEERVPGVGIRLDVVIDPDCREDLVESLPGSPVGAVLSPKLRAV
jgi:hypothetical protein